MLWCAWYDHRLHLPNVYKVLSKYGEVHVSTFWLVGNEKKNRKLKKNRKQKAGFLITVLLIMFPILILFKFILCTCIIIANES